MTVVASNYVRKENDLPEAVRDAISYDPATGKIAWTVRRALKRPGDEAGHIGANGYRTVTVDYVAYYAHHLASPALDFNPPLPGWVMTYEQRRSGAKLCVTPNVSNSTPNISGRE